MACSEYREAAGATAENLICLTKVKALSSISRFHGRTRCDTHGYSAMQRSWDIELIFSGQRRCVGGSDGHKG
jgi:hypothetical protein